jgi:hypothetical protein
VIRARSKVGREIELLGRQVHFSLAHHNAAATKVDLEGSARDLSDGLDTWAADESRDVKRKLIARVCVMKRFEASGLERGVALAGVVAQGHDLSSLGAELVQQHRRSSCGHVEYDEPRGDRPRPHESLSRSGGLHREHAARLKGADELSRSGSAAPDDQNCRRVARKLRALTLLRPGRLWPVTGHRQTKQPPGVVAPSPGLSRL